MILDARRTARDLQAQRELADQAEASRFTELQRVLDARLEKLQIAVAEAQARTGDRLDRVDTDFRSALERATNTLAAYIGEAEDRIERRVGGSSATPRT